MEIKLIVLILAIFGCLNLVYAGGTTNLQCPAELQEVDKIGSIPIEVHGYLPQTYQIEVKCPDEIIVESTFTVSQGSSINYEITKPDEIYECTMYLYLEYPRILQDSCVISMVWREDIEPIIIEPSVEPEPQIETSLVDRIFSWFRTLFS